MCDPENLSVQLSDNPYSPMLTRDARILGHGATLNGKPTPFTSYFSSSLANVCFTTPQCLNCKAWLLGLNSSKNKASLWKVVERTAAPQCSSTRTVYKSKWALFEKFCRDNLVYFSSPSVKQVSDFLGICFKA